MWATLERESLLSPEILDVLKTGDELSAIQELMPERFDALLTDLINRLHQELAQMKDPSWLIAWTSSAD